MIKKSTAVALLLLLTLCAAGCTGARSPENESTAPSASVGAQPEESTQPQPDEITTQPSTQQTTQPTTEPVATQPTTQQTVVPEEELSDDDLVRVVDYIPQIRQHLVYATSENFTGRPIYEFRDAYLRYGTVKKLSEVCKELESRGLGLLIWDGYRPVSAQEKLFRLCPDPTFVSPPGVGNQNHCRGRAVDLTLVDLETGKELEMPSEFDDFTPYADRDYADVSAEAAANATVLEEVMTRHGFEGYSAEWWHFNDTDEYPVEETFDPAMIH